METALTLCSHAHLAYSLRAGYDQAQRAASLKSWESPSIFTLDEWLASLWMAHGDRLLLTSDQELLLWREIIGHEVGDKPLLDLSSTAARAAEAWNLAHAWLWDWKLDRLSSTAETEAFQRWSGEFRRLLDHEHWITAAELPAALPPSPPEVMQLAGFDPGHLTPQHQTLFNALAAGGARLEYRPTFSVPARAVVATATDAVSEVALAAAWARQRLEQGSAGPIGVVVLDLAQRRAEVERIFAQTFHPDLAPWDHAPRAFHLSLGLPLSVAPMPAAALRYLGSLGRAGPLDLATVLDLVRSPFLAAADTEAAARARLESTLRCKQRPAWRWSDVLHFAHHPCPALVRALGAALASVRAWPARQLHQAWIESFSAVWQALGWPGERPLDSVAWQTLRAWERLCDDFGRLDQVSPTPISASEALARLNVCAAARNFQPRAEPAPVQVLGWLEAAGLEFTDLWVCGLDDEALPAVPRPNPFLPLDWQRRAGLPHASAATEADSAQRLWDRLRHSCHSTELIASHAVRAADGHDLSPSPLLAGCKPWGGSLPMAVSIEPPGLEPVADSQAPLPSEAERHGPTDLLRDQSACPFRAFAHYRLHARHAPSPQPGLAATTRGSLLHAVLKALWDELGSSARLQVGDALRQRLDTLAAAAVANERGLDRLPGLAAVERQRLTDTVYAWCEQVESRRPAFRVLATEEKLDAVPFAGLNLNLRRDRVDALEDGAGRLLLDYKSGEVSTKLWEGDRPEEPQVPLYLLTDSDPSSVVAVAFAQVRAGDMKFIQLEGGEIPRATWKHALGQLAAEYLRGHAAVDPRDDDCCTFCDLHALCRIRDSA